MELVAKQIVELCPQFKRQFFASVSPAILQAHYQVNKIGVRQQDGIVADQFAHFLQTLRRIVLTHQLANLRAKHRIVVRQTDTEMLLIPGQCAMLVPYQFIGWVQCNDVLVILEGWKVGRKAFAIACHGGVEDDVDIRIAKCLQGLNLVLE